MMKPLFRINLIMGTSRKNNNAIPIEKILQWYFEDADVAHSSYAEATFSNLDKSNENYNKKDYRTAIEFYEKVINDPNYKKAWNNKGRALYELGEVRQSLEHLMMILLQSIT
ncbi:MAG: tetratricopeptide repeat protein [Candidatus Nitrosopolaris sp.]|jgi:tetratricopeptide (TPR) repeat protein